MRAIAFPASEDVAQQMVGHGPNHGMNVVGHDDPRGEQIALPIKVPKRVGDQLSDVGSPQPARSRSLVKVALHPPVIVAVNCLLRFRRRIGSRSAFRGVATSQERLQSLGALGLELKQDFPGQGVVKTKGDEIR